MKSDIVKGVLLAVGTAAAVFICIEARNVYWVVKESTRLAIKFNSVVAQDKKSGQSFTYEQMVDTLLIKELQKTEGK